MPPTVYKKLSKTLDYLFRKIILKISIFPNIEKEPENIENPEKTVKMRGIFHNIETYFPVFFSLLIDKLYSSNDFFNNGELQDTLDGVVRGAEAREADRHPGRAQTVIKCLLI